MGFRFWTRRLRSPMEQHSDPIVDRDIARRSLPEQRSPLSQIRPSRAGGCFAVKPLLEMIKTERIYLRFRFGGGNASVGP